MSFVQKALGTEKGINITNMGLMVLSAAIAFVLPFKLFLFVYAILGPLHYLTEISWLNKRNFFVEKKIQVWPYVLSSFLLTLCWFNSKIFVMYYQTTLMLSVVAYTLFITLTKKPVVSIAGAVVVLVLGVVFKIDRLSPFVLVLSVLLPTLIHVFVFTGVFVLAGALKTKSGTGFLSLVIFILCALSFVFINPANTEVLSVAEKGAISKFFLALNKYLGSLLGVSTDGSQESYFVAPGLIALQRFIAFAYTYHYLNWFSKTTVIKWHEVSKSSLYLILFLWALAVGCYLFDYSLGFIVLYFLSILHVFLEFPLNVASFRNAGQGIRNIFVSK